jgi:DHA3 family macrolide efflux protein-like MFS transporter
MSNRKTTARAKKDPPYRGDDWQRNFFPMWIGQVLSLIGSRVVQFALIWYLAQTTGSATTLALAALVGLVPEILLGPIAGAYVDRWDRQLVMIVSDGAVALASWGLAYLFWVDAVEIWIIYVILFIRSIGGSFHLPAMQSSISLMVPEEQLTRVNGLNQMVNGVLTIAGPALGAFMLLLLPYYGIMLVDVATAILAIFLLMVINVPLPDRKDPGQEQPSLWLDLREGMAYLLGWRGLMIMVGMAMLTRFLLTPAYTLLPLMVSGYFNGPPGQLGLLEGFLGLGMLAGGVILSLWGGFKRRIYTTMAGFVVLGIGLLVMGLAPAGLFVIALAGVLVIGLAVPLVDGPMMAILQASVDPNIQGRVFSLMGSLVGLAAPVGLILAGPISDWLGIQTWFLLSGILCVIIGISLYFIPSVVHIEAQRPVLGQEEAI